MSATIAVTGSTGLVGEALCAALVANGDDVLRLVRKEMPAPIDGTRAVLWNPEAPLDPQLLVGCEAVVHLAGKNLAEGRWTEERKQKIRESRSGPTRRIAEALVKLERPPRVFFSASAIGIYGHRGEDEVDESTPPGAGFLTEVCVGWEAACEPARSAGIRVINGRIGIVLSPKGGVLAKQLLAFRLGAGAMFGNGKQWISWITLDDLITAIQNLLAREALVGPVNLISPNPVTNRDFGATLARVLGRPYLLTVPSFALRLLFGEVADEALLSSTKVKPTKLLNEGFRWQHPELEGALRHMLG